MAESDLEILRLASSNLEVPAGVRHSSFTVHLRIFLALTLVSIVQRVVHTNYNCSWGNYCGGTYLGVDLEHLELETSAKRGHCTSRL